MEHEQRTTHEPSSSTSAYCSTLEELDATSSYVYTRAVEDAEEWASCQHWTSVDYTSGGNDEGYVRVLPGKNVIKYTIDQIKLLEKIGEGGQGTIYTAKLYRPDDGKEDHLIRAVKLYRGRKFGQWPEAAFGLHLADWYICHFYGYCLDGDLFYLVMTKYDCSLRDVLDKQMKKQKFKGGPLPDVIALRMIIQIAIGMGSLHDNNIIHRDLKADNVFVTTTSSGIPLSAHIGDFDVASNVLGSRFWRAPEVLQALKDEMKDETKDRMKDRKGPVFTQKADVYSYAMTCYEILTGDVPLRELRVSDYDAVLIDGKRPKLPSDLNPKLKDFLRRCWHQDPEARPTFKEIVGQLRELHKELITGSELVSSSFDAMFLNGKCSLNMIEDSPDDSLLELKTVLQAALVKYNQSDYLVLLMEIVADFEQYQSTFGLRSMKEHPALPLREYCARMRMFHELGWKFKVFLTLGSPTAEMVDILRLCTNIIEAIFEGEDLGRPTQPPSDEDADFMLNFKAWWEEYRARVLPDTRHWVSEAQGDKDLQELLNAKYMSQMRCGGESWQILSACRQWLGID